jgi:hypothetical protein
MPERLIAFASTWFHRDGQHIVARRGETHDIPENEVERLDKLGALVPEGGELERPGQLIKLLASAEGEHVRNYLDSGKTDEIIAQLPDYPLALVDRVAIAERAGQAREDLLLALDRRLRSENELTEPVTVPDVPVSTIEPVIAVGRSIDGASTVEDSAGGVPDSSQDDSGATTTAPSRMNCRMPRAG